MASSFSQFPEREAISPRPAPVRAGSRRPAASAPALPGEGDQCLLPRRGTRRAVLQGRGGARVKRENRKNKKNSKKTEKELTFSCEEGSSGVAFVSSSSLNPHSSQNKLKRAKSLSKETLSLLSSPHLSQPSPRRRRRTRAPSLRGTSPSRGARLAL